MSSPAGLRRLPSRIGQVLIAPRAALERIEVEGGGFRDAVWLVAVGVVTFRFSQLLEALLGLSEGAVGALTRVAGVVANEVTAAAWVVIPAAVLVTVAAGRRRDASLDLELGAACYVPFFAVRAVARAFEAITRSQIAPTLASEVVGGIAAVVVLVRAVQVARRRVPAASPPGEGAAPRPVPADASAAASVALPLPTTTTTTMGPRAAAAGAAVMAVALAGLAGNAAWVSRHIEALRPMKSGQRAPAFALPRLDGRGSLAIEDLRGQVVVLDFWATWCPPCLAMMPVLHDLHGEWAPRGVTFVGVNSDGGGLTRPELEAFMREHPSPYAIVIDDGSANALYRVRALPELVVIGRDGAIRGTFHGYTGRRTLADALARAVGE